MVHLRGLPVIGGPCSSASDLSFSALRPVRIGSGISRRSSETFTPPCFMIARMERTRCWLVPMRPVTPFRMMPRVLVSMGMNASER